MTIPHEVAHFAGYQLYSSRHIRLHDNEWRELMQMFGEYSRCTALFNLEGLPARIYRRHTCYCVRNTWQLTSRRHDRIICGQAQYHNGTAVHKTQD